MRRMRRRWPLAAGLGLILTALAGCQTWMPEAGLTLPSGRYLEHPPQYIPQEQSFPLERELAGMEGAPPAPAGGEAAPGGAPGGAP
jgi:hypothetical protein